MPGGWQGQGKYKMMIREGGKQKELRIWEQGRFEEARAVSNGLRQVSYHYPGPGVWVWAPAEGMTWSVTLMKAERMGLYRVGPAPRQLKHSGGSYTSHGHHNNLTLSSGS